MILLLVVGYLCLAAGLGAGYWLATYAAALERDGEGEGP
jgi:hypothetical protein